MAHGIPVNDLGERVDPALVSETRVSVDLSHLGGGLTYLECPCCGDDGAVSDGQGRFFDGQSLICGCPGWVSVDSDGDDDPYINNGDAECLKCGVVGVR